MKSELTACVFCIDNMNLVKGFHDPYDKWNGWAKPYFDKETVEYIMSKSDNLTMNGDVLILENEIEVLPEIINGIKLWGFGPFGWVWTALPFVGIHDDDVIELPRSFTYAKDYGINPNGRFQLSIIEKNSLLHTLYYDNEEDRDNDIALFDYAFDIEEL